MRMVVARIQQLLPNTPFARGVVAVASGTAAGQLLVLLASPILTRLYSPEQFGIYGAFAALLGIVGPFAGLRYELAIQLPRSDKKAETALGLTLICVFGVTVVVAILVAIFRENVAAWVHSPSLAAYLWLLPLGVLLQGTSQTFAQWATRTRAFNRFSLAQLQTSLGATVSKVGLGLAHVGTLGLIVGQIIGLWAGLAGLYRIFKNREKAGRIRLSRVQGIATARRYRRFPLYMSGATLINGTSNHMPPLLLAGFFSPAAAGFYVIAQRVGAAPLTFIGNAVRNVFFPNAAEAQREGRLGELTTKAFTALLKTGTMPLAALAFIAPDLFALVFGEEWRQAGLYLRWLIPWLAAQFVVSPLTGIFSVMERQDGELVLQGGLLVVRLVSFAIGIYMDNVFIAIILFGITSFAVFGCFGAALLYLARTPIKPIIRILTKQLLRVAGLLLLMEAAQHLVLAGVPNAPGLAQMLVAMAVAAPIVGWQIWRVV